MNILVLLTPEQLLRKARCWVQEAAPSGAVQWVVSADAHGGLGDDITAK